MKEPTSNASPAKSLLQEIEDFRSAGHTTLDAIRSDIDGRLDAIKALVADLEAAGDIPPKKLRDIRDMLVILSHPRMKPEKGRLRDVKKMESIAEDLEMMVEGWN
jgi:hypothetical protein